MVAMAGSVDADDVPTNMEKLQEKYLAEHAARLKAEARVEELEVENKQIIGDTVRTVSGEVARRWMSIAQCFAGPPESPPPIGMRFRSASGG